MEKIVTMEELNTAFHQYGDRVQIETPDGWVPIINWFNMGVKPIQIIKTTNHELRCASTHMVEVQRDGSFVWMMTNELINGDCILTASGTEPVISIQNDGEEECFDIEVGHSNHRYWAEGISSHNCGKSFGIGKVLAKDDLFDTLAERAPKYEIIKGSMSSIGLYCKLWEHRKDNHVMVLDDADELFNSEESLNLLKGALDSGEKRVISWNKDSRVLRDEAIDNSFEFRGAVIVITNLNFSMVKSKKLQPHLKALESRCHMIDLGMDTMREKFLWIREHVSAGMLDRYDFTDEGNMEIVSFMQDNSLKLREISLRMVTKIADLKRAFPKSWQRMASTTCVRK